LPRASLFRLDAPDGIEGVLELNHDTDGCKQQGDDSEQRDEEPLPGPPGARQHGLNGPRARAAQQAFHLGAHLTSDRILAEQ
jgi:hypothetical protein